jgi:hypothetical protein
MDRFGEQNQSLLRAQWIALLSGAKSVALESKIIHSRGRNQLLSSQEQNNSLWIAKLLALESRIIRSRGRNQLLSSWERNQLPLRAKSSALDSEVTRFREQNRSLSRAKSVALRSEINCSQK